MSDWLGPTFDASYSRVGCINETTVECHERRAGEQVAPLLNKGAANGG